MKKRITKEQKDFLIYVRDNHFGLGWTQAIDKIIFDKWYKLEGVTHREIKEFVNDWKEYVLEGQAEYSEYGKPTKYLR